MALKHRSLRGPVAVDELPRAGELLAVEAVDRSGMVVTSDGAFVRLIEVRPPNPLILSDEERRQTAASFCHLAGRLRPGQTLQFYVQARPVDIDELLANSRQQVSAWAGPAPTARTPPADRRSRDRWRLYGAMEESIRLHATDQAAVELNAYVVIPYLPARNEVSHLLAMIKNAGKPAALLERDASAHRRVVRESLAHSDAIRGDLEAMNLETRALCGQEVVELLWSRFNPTGADRGRRPRWRPEILGELDTVSDAQEACQAAVKLRELIADAAIDFAANPAHAEIDRDLEQTIYAASTADSTYFGWLMGAMLTCRQPFCLSVFVRALDRRRERQRLKMSYRRLFAINRQAEANGRVPDFERYLAEGEHERLLGEMSGHDRASIFEVSIYQSIRSRGPNPDSSLLTDAVNEAAEQITSASDCRPDRGRYQQPQLWRSTLPLGVDVARRARKYATRNVGDCIPLLGVAVGSPDGVPFASTQPGRTLEHFNPFDRSHANHLCLVTGRSGAGKTMLCNTLMARCIAHGARGFVIDRAGHYRVLTELIDGAQHIDIGADDARFALNPWDVENPGHVSREKVAFLIGLHQTMLPEGLSSLERAQLGAAIRAVYQHAHDLGVIPRESLLRDELLHRAAAEQDAGSPQIAFVLRNLAERLGEFCGHGAYAHIADRDSTHVPDSPLLVFDTRKCPEAVLKPVIFTVLEFVTRTIERHRDSNRELAARADAPLMAGRSILLGDEFWAVVSNPALGGYANDLARRSRHLGVALLIATQQLSDLDNEYGLALLRNSTMQLFLAQHREELQFVQRALGLTDNEVALIARLKTVKGAYSQAFWVNGARGRGQIALRLGPLEYWAFTSDPVKDAPLRDQKVLEHGGDVWHAIADLAGHHNTSTPTNGAPWHDDPAG